MLYTRNKHTVSQLYFNFWKKMFVKTKSLCQSYFCKFCPVVWLLKSAIIIQIQSRPTKKESFFFFLALIDTKLLLSVSWKISKISYERNVNMIFDCWRILESKIANELAIVGCEIILLIFFSFHKYLVIKSVFQVT